MLKDILPDNNLKVSNHEHPLQILKSSNEYDSGWICGYRFNTNPSAANPKLHNNSCYSGVNAPNQTKNIEGWKCLTCNFH